MTVDERLMRLALAQARKGVGHTHPNPAVGAVIVKAGQVIARGYHHRAGSPHAEIEALKVAGARARGATLYSTLEPCDHFGRTPPCTRAILAAGIARVVFGSNDPNPLVNGRGQRRLKAGGVQVTAGVLQDEADALNRPFLKFMRTGLPWVTLKVAITLDGKLATSTGDSKWVTSAPARARVHQLRAQVDAVLVGSGTVIADDPRLTARPGARAAKSPVRVIVDSRLQTSPGSAVYRTAGQPRTVVATLRPHGSKQAQALTRLGAEVWPVKGRSGRVDLRALLQRLGQAGLLHVLVEGGAQVHGALLQAGLFDEVLVFVAPKLVGGRGLTWTGGLDVRQMARALALELTEIEPLGDDLLITASPRARSRSRR